MRQLFRIRLSKLSLSRHDRSGSFAFGVVPSWIYLVAILVGGSLPSGGGSGGVSDKTLHFFVFLFFAPLVARALAFYRPTEGLAVKLMRATGLSSLVGGALELWQFCLPHRSCEFLDWVADTVGAGVGCMLLGGITLLGSWRARGHKPKLTGD